MGSPDIFLTLVSIALFVGLGAVMVLLTARLVKIENGAFVGLVSFVVHLIFALVLFRSAGYFLPDALLYDRLGVINAQLLLGDLSYAPTFTEGKEGWPRFLGVVYAVVGHLPELGLVFNAALIGVLTLLVGHAARLVGGGRASMRLAMLGVNVCPGILLWGDLLLREASVYVLTLTIAIGALTISQARARGLILMGAALVPLLSFRQTAALIVTPAALLGLVVRWVPRRWNPIVYRTAVLTVAVVALPLALSLLESQYNITLDSLNRSREALARRATSRFDDIGVASSLGDAVQLSLVMLPVAGAGPFPWQWTGTSVGILSAVDAVFWWVMITLILRAWLTKRLTANSIVLLVPALALLMVLAFTSGNFGSLIRYRTMVAPLLIPIAALAFGGSGKSADNEEESSLDAVNDVAQGSVRER